VADLIHADTGQTVSVPDEQVPKLFLSGKYGLPGDTVTVRSPDGKLGTMPAETAGKAFQQGYQFVGAEAANQALDEQQYGEGLGNSARAFAGSALSTATLGLSDVAERHLAPEAADAEAKVRRYNPLSSGAGALAGGVGLTVATGGLGGAAEGAGAATGIAGQVARVGARIATDAGYGAAFGLGNQVSEAALGDTELTAEHALDAMGSGALWGAGTGLALLGAGKVVAPLLEKAQGAVSHFADTMSGIAEKIGSADNLGEVASTDVKAATKAANEMLTTNREMGREFRGEGGIREAEAQSHLMGRDPEPIRADLQQTITDAKAKLDEMMRTPDTYEPGLVKKGQAALDRLEGVADTATTAMDLRNGVRDAVDDLGNHAFSTTKASAFREKQVTEELQGLWKGLKDHLQDSELYGEQGAREQAISSAENALKDRSWAKQDAPAVKAFKKEFGYSGSKDLQVDPAKMQSYLKLKALGDPRADLKEKAMMDMVQLVKGYADVVSDSHANVPRNLDFSQYEQLAQRHSDVTGSLNPLIEKGAESQAALKAGPAGPSTAQKLIIRGLDRVPLVGPALGHVVQNPGVAIETLSRLAKTSDRALGVMRSGVRKFLNGTGATGGGLAADEILSGTRFGTGTRGDSSFAKRTKEIDQLAGNPEALASRLGDAIGPIQTHAPQVGAQLLAKATTVIQYAQSITPRDPNAQFAVNANKTSWRPSETQLRDYAAGLAGATKPTQSLAKQLASGMLNSKTLAAAQACHPKTVQAFKTHIMSELASSDRDLSYPQKMVLSKFFGAPLSVSMTQGGIQALQATYAPPPKPATQNALGKLDLAKGLTLQSQKVV